MPTSTVDQAAAVPVALSAFLRGVERRAALFGELQCGNREVADGALAAAMRAFRTHAATLAMAGWPHRFWALLVAAPPLRRAAPAAQWPQELQLLGQLESLPRQALLLRLVAGLAEDTAADVLGLGQAEYEQALAKACPRDAQGDPDSQAWRVLAETLQRQLRDLPPDRLTRLALLRETAIAPVPAKLAVRAGSAAPVQGPASPAGPDLESVRFSRPFWAFGVVMACALALLVTWRPGEISSAASAGPDGDWTIQVEPLPEQPVAQRFDPEQAAATHPDLPLVLDAREAAVAAQAGFLAWYVAGRQERSDQVSPTDGQATEADIQPPALDAAEARDQPPPRSVLPAVQTLAQQLAEWDALPPGQRRQRRAVRVAWLALEESERARLRQAASELESFPAERHAALLAQFDALDGREQWGWRLGGVIGADYPALFGLLGYVTPAQRDPLLAVLRGLDATQRADLAVLAQRTPPQDQQALLDALLAQSPATRAGWLRSRVRPD